jgi:hypothetical protein
VDQFNLDDYFAQRFGAASLNMVPDPSKESQVEAASNAKKKSLYDMAMQRKAEQDARDQRAYDNSFAKSIGLDPQGAAGGAVDAARFGVDSVVSGAGNVAGGILNVPSGIVKVADATGEALRNAGRAVGLPESITEAKYVAPQDLIRPLADGFKVGDQKFTGLGEFGDNVRNVAVGLSNKQNQERFNEINALGNQAAADVVNKGDWGKVAELIASPAAWTYGVGQAAPSIVAAAFGGVPAMFGMEFGSATQDVRNYEAKNGKVSDTAAATAILESAGVNTLLEKFGLEKVMGKAGKSQLGKALAERIGATRHIAAGTVAEGGTEMLQTVNENLAKKLNYDPTQNLTDGVLLSGMGGAGTGGVMSTGVAIAEKPANRGEKSPKADKPNAADFAKSVEANDPTPYLDPQSSTYDPVKAVEVLMGHAQRKDATPEVRTGNLEKAANVVTDLEKQVEKAHANVLNSGPEGLKVKKDLLAKQQEKLAALPEDDAAGRADTQDNINRLQDLIAHQSDLEANVPGLKLKHEALQKQLEGARNVRDQFVTEVAAKATPEQLNADIEAADTVVDPANPQANQSNALAAERVVSLAMASVDRIDGATAKRLADNESNSLTTAQRTYLKRFSEAQAAQNAVKGIEGVQSDVLNEGIRADGGRNLGIQAYRKEVGQALVSNDRAKADRYLGLLKNFAQGHQNKAQAVAEARAQFDKTGKPHWAVPQGNTAWEVSTTPMTEQERAAVGAVRIDNGTANLAARIDSEATAVNAVLAELRAAHGLRFGKTAKAVPTPVPAQPKQTEAAQEAPEPEVQAKASEVLPEGASEIPAKTETQSAQQTSQASVEKVKAEPKSTKDTPPPPQADASVAEKPAPVAEVQTQPVPAPAVKQPKSSLAVNLPPWLESSEGWDGESDVASTTKAGAVEQPTGKLAVMQQTTPEGTPYQQQNTIADNLKQTASKEGDATERPLVAVKDFASRLLDNVEFAQQFLKDPLTDAQRQAIHTFAQRAKKWGNLIRDNLKVLSDKNGKPQRAFYFKDVMQFLIQEVPGLEGQPYADVEENVKTAIALGVQNYLVEQSSQSEQATDEAINMVLGQPESMTPTWAQREAIGHLGVLQSTLLNSIGQSITQALGFSTLKTGQQDVLPRLQTVLGAYALHMMVKGKVLTQTTRTGAQLNALVKKTKTGKTPYEAGAKISFYAIKRLPSREGVTGQPVRAIQQMVDSVKGSQNVLDTLFGTEALTRFPSFEAVPFDQKNPAHSKQMVPSVQAKVLNKRQQEPHHFDLAKLTPYMMLGDQTALAIAGVEKVDPETTHIDERRSIQARNDALVREHTLLGEFIQGYMLDAGRDLNTPFYLQYEVWKQQRVGQKTNGINPQMSKLHRGLMTMPDWTSTIEIGAQSQTDFRTLVAENMGVKVEQVKPDELQGKIAALYANPVIQDGIAAIRALWAADAADSNAMANTEQQAAIQAAVAVGGENMASFNALVAMAQEAVAQEQGPGATFTTDLLSEIDGVTNGIILSYLAFGAGASVDKLLDRLAKGGIFGKGSGLAKYNDWRTQQGNKDTYEGTLSAVQNQMALAISSGKASQEAADAIWKIIGGVFLDEKISSGERNFIKKTVQAIFFGASIPGQVDSLAGSFVETLIHEISKRAQENTPHAELVQAFNALMVAGERASLSLPENISRQDLLDHHFTDDQVRTLQEVFQRTVGPSLTDILTNEHQVYLAARSSLNATAEATFGIYNAVKQGMTQALQADTVDTDKAGTPYHDITVEQARALEKKLAPVAPVIATAMSQESGQVSAGLRMAKTEQHVNHDLAYESEVHFGEAFPGTNNMSMRVHGWSTQDMSPGTAMIATSMHSLDAAISIAGQAQNQVLNLHDAHGTGVAKHDEVGAALNKAAIEKLLEYSPLRAASDALSRSLQGLAKMLAQPDLPVQVRENLLGTVQAMLTKQQEANPQARLQGVLTTLLEQAKQAAVRADTVRLQTITQIEVVDQYPSGKDGYVVPDSIHEEAQKRLEALDASLTTAEKQALQVIAEVLGNTQQAKQAKQEQAADPTPATEERDAPAAQTGLLGLLPARSLELLDSALADDSLPGDLRANYTAMLELLHNGQTDLNAAMREATEADQQPRIVEDLSQRYNILAKHFGEALGGNNNLNDEGLVAALEARGQMTATQLVGVLRQRLEQSKYSLSPIQRALLDRIGSLVNPKLTVQYVTPLTQEAKLQGKPATASHGWYTYSNSAETIFVFSPEFKSSLITPEVLLHELTHAALFRLMDQVENSKPGDKGYDADAAQLVGELKSLLEEARAFVAKNTSTQQQAAFAPALVNVHEFVAWGLNNKAFIRDVLTKMQVDAKNYPGSSYTLMDGAKAFFSRIVGLMFGKTAMLNMNVNSGYALLVRNTAGLFERVAQERPAYRGNGSLAMESVDAALSLDKQGILDALSDPQNVLPVAFTAHLSNVLNSIVKSLHGPFGAFESLQAQNPAITPSDVYGKSAITGEVPFSSDLAALALPLTEQELFVGEQVEATVRDALRDTGNTMTQAYKELTKLFRQAYKQVKVADLVQGDWNLASAEEQAQAQRLFDQMFRIDTTEATSDHLARFVGLALGSQKINTLLQVAQERATTPTEKLPLAQRLYNWFERVLSWFADVSTGTVGMHQVSERLEHLAQVLVDLDAKKQSQIARARNASLDWAEEKLDAVVVGARQLVTRAASSNVVRNSGNAVVRAAGTSIRIVGNKRADQLLLHITRLRDNHIKAQHGLFMKTVNYVRGPAQQFQEMLRGVTKINERTRKELITDVARVALESFINNGKDLTAEDKVALTRMLRADVKALTGRYSMDRLGELFEDPKALAKEIEATRKKLGAHRGASDFFIKQAHALGYFLVTERVTIPGLLRNAQNIARQLGTAQEDKLKGSQLEQATEDIDVLASLYALHYTSLRERRQVSQILRAESHRIDGSNGIDQLLKMHAMLADQAFQYNFDSNPTQMQKGYLPDVTNPYTEILAADEIEGRSLKNQMWVQGEALPLDPADPNHTTRHLYTLRNAGPIPRVSGIMSITSEKHRGSRNQETFGGISRDVQVRAIQHAQRKGVAQQAQPDPFFDPAQVTESYMAPVFNADGRVAEYAYLMNAATKDTTLERNNAFDHLLGVMAGQSFDKVASKSQNRDALQAHQDLYEKEYAGNSEMFAALGPNSTDPHMRDVWRLLPHDTQQAILEISGTDAMMIRKDLVDITFGYRKASIIDMFEKDPEARNLVENTIVQAATALIRSYARYTQNMTAGEADEYAERTANLLRRGEAGWQMIAREVKSTIVIRVLSTMIGNIWSNFTLLAAHGMWQRPIQMLRWHYEAVTGLTQYQRQSRQLRELKIQMAAGYFPNTTQAAVQREIDLLTDAINRNPVKPLIDDGLMPTIVEDIAADEDIYSYKSQLQNKFDKQIQKVPKLLRTVGKHVYMTKDTPQYQLLNHVTQISDFMGRYTLYKHLTSQSKPLSDQAAKQVASEAFVNYDIPMPRGLQYLDDTMVVPFTKYFLSIQRVLAKLSVEHPARMLSMVLLNNYLGLLPSVMASSVINRVGYLPVKDGIFEYPGALVDSAMVSAGLGLVK